MTTLSATKARVNLTALLKRAADGEDIGILCGDQVIALRPVPVVSADKMEMSAAAPVPRNGKAARAARPPWRDSVQRLRRHYGAGSGSEPNPVVAARRRRAL